MARGPRKGPGESPLEEERCEPILSGHQGPLASNTVLSKRQSGRWLLVPANAKSPCQVQAPTRTLTHSEPPKGPKPSKIPTQKPLVISEMLGAR